MNVTSLNSKRLHGLLRISKMYNKANFKCNDESCFSKNTQWWNFNAGLRKKTCKELYQNIKRNTAVCQQTTLENFNLFKIATKFHYRMLYMMTFSCRNILQQPKSKRKCQNFGHPLWEMEAEKWKKAGKMGFPFCQQTTHTSPFGHL